MNFLIRIFQGLSQQIPIRRTGPTKYMQLILKFKIFIFSKCCFRGFMLTREKKDSGSANVKWKYLFLKYNLTYFKVMTAFDIFITSGSKK